VARRRGIPVAIAVTLAVTALLLGMAAATRAEEPRTLEAVEIEGEVRLPQVLFITSRDVERPLDWLDHYAAAAPAEERPVRVFVVPAPLPSPVPGSVVDAPAGPTNTEEPHRSLQEESR
jgi:hypothetical protein